jgi:phosphatidylglycerol:prolipoprotein diacylglycerol transferase
MTLDAHTACEVLAYSLGIHLYMRNQHRWPRAAVGGRQTELLGWCMLGALVGSRALAWEGGKTIVGGLLGGWIGVECGKLRLGIAHSTGDALVFPLILGIAIGRVGCFMAGLEDGTFGLPTALPWAVDFGDGVPRHPTQIYEIAFLVVLGVALAARARRPYWNGLLFRQFMLGYLSFRFAVDAIKPGTPLVANLTAIQMACVAGAVYSGFAILHGRRAEAAASS